MSRLYVPRWLIAPPGPQETYSSMLERAVERYGAIEPWWGVGPDNAPDFPPGQTIDDPGNRRIILLADRMGLPPAHMRMHRLPESADLLAPTVRRVFCPACWRANDEAEEPRAYRGPWQSLFSITCDRHPDVLLRLAPPWRERMSRQRIWVGNTEGTGAINEAVLRWLKPLARAMGDAVAGRAPWPSGWRGGVDELKLLLILMTGRVSPFSPSPLIEHLTSMAVLRPRRRAAGPLPTHRPSWATVRHLGDPEARQSLLWLAAWFHSCPEDPSLWPAWMGRVDQHVKRLPRGALSYGDPLRYATVSELAVQLLRQVDPVIQAAERMGTLDLGSSVVEALGQVQGTSACLGGAQGVLFDPSTDEAMGRRS
jgi:hypothetical protein